MIRQNLLPLVLVPILAFAGPALADDAAAASFHLQDLHPLTLQPESPPAADAPAPAAEDAPLPAPDESRPTIPYGRAGGRWLTIGSAVANDFGDDTDVNVHIAASWFLADEMEWGIEAAGWGFFQEGDNTGGLSASLLFRWHFWHAEDYSWTIFGDIGIGLLAAFDTVPDGGTGFDFLPRAGAGATFRVSEECDTRLMVGLRWHHISNGRIEGDENNPGRDALMFYVGVVFPF